MATTLADRLHNMLGMAAIRWVGESLYGAHLPALPGGLRPRDPGGASRLMRSGRREPLNLGQDRMLTINELVDRVAAIAGKRIGKRHDLARGPAGHG